MKEPKIAVVGTKGQVVIPQEIRRELGIKAKTRLAFFSREDKLVVAKLEMPSLNEELTELFDEIDKRYKGRKKPSERDILSEIQAYRKEKRKNLGT